MTATTRSTGPVRRRNPAIRAVQAILGTVVVLLLILAIFLAVFVRHDADGETTLLGHPIYSVASGSMAPTFNTGDMIVDKAISGAAAERLHKGQIITFQAPSAAGSSSTILITHRIYAVVKEASVPGRPPVEYRTKGDANNTPDAGLVAPPEIIGVYQQRVPFGGFVLSSLHQPITFVILILIPIIFLVEEEIRRRWIALGEQDAQRRRSPTNHQGEL